MAPIDSYALPMDGSHSLRDRLVFLLRGGLVKRFHNGAVLQENTVASHSWGVAWFAYLLMDGHPSARLLLAAMAHDMAEQITSDVSAPAKRLLGIRDLLAEREGAVLETYNLHFEDALDDAEQASLKIADAMDGMLFCIRERMFGNKFAKYTFSKFRSYIGTICETNTSQAVLAALDELWEDANSEGK